MVRFKKAMPKDIGKLITSTKVFFYGEVGGLWSEGVRQIDADR